MLTYGLVLTPKSHLEADPVPGSTTRFFDSKLHMEVLLDGE